MTLSLLDKSKAPLTIGDAKTMGSVHLIVDPNRDADGGWAVYTTYPK